MYRARSRAARTTLNKPSSSAPPGRLLALTATSLGTFITSISSSITNTALPTIVTSFHITSAQSIWVVNGVQLATTMTLLFFGAASDARGTKRLYLTGMFVFALATLGCALAPNFTVLVLMRVLQGFGGSAVIVTVNSLNRALFPPAELGRSLAVNTTFVAVGTVSGPTIGGLILAFASWPWIFAFIVPFALLALGLGWRYLPHIPPTGAKLDYPSAALAAVAFGTLFFALDGFARPGSGLGDIAFGATGLIAMAISFTASYTSRTRCSRSNSSASRSSASRSSRRPQRMRRRASRTFRCRSTSRTCSARRRGNRAYCFRRGPFASLIVAMQMGRLSDRHPASVLCTLGILVMGAGLAGFALLPGMARDLDDRHVRRHRRGRFRNVPDTEQPRHHDLGTARKGPAAQPA